MLALRINPDRHNNTQLQSQLYVTQMSCRIYSDLHNFTQRQFGLYGSQNTSTAESPGRWLPLIQPPLKLEPREIIFST